MIPSRNLEFVKMALIQKVHKVPEPSREGEIHDVD